MAKARVPQKHQHVLLRAKSIVSRPTVVGFRGMSKVRSVIRASIRPVQPPVANGVAGLLNAE